MTYRAGMIIPVIARTSSTGDLRKHMPFPKASGTLGIGIHLKKYSLDVALFGDPGRSYAQQKPVIQCMGSATFRF